MKQRAILATILLTGICLSPGGCRQSTPSGPDSPSPIANRPEEVVFWHFWGGTDRDVVEHVVRRFNQSQSEYRVRAVAMPGNNLQAKLFLSVAGGDPPDLVNQDDPILADWARRDIILPLDEIAPPNEVQSVSDWLYPSARKLSTYENRMYGVCNGLDIRALYFNRTALEQAGLSPPTTLSEFNSVVERLTPGSNSALEQYAYLPDSRRLWAWGYVFGGRFIDESTGRVTLTDLPLVAALDWMQGFARRYGPDNIAAFRQGDQSLPGKSFPLLPATSDQMTGRYTLIMDGQWRVRDINAFLENRQAEGVVAPEFGVAPLPPPPGGRRNAGWVNGNFFVIPRNARQTRGSWEFIKFWVGFSSPREAVITNIEGGWIPVSDEIVQHPDYQAYLDEQPLFAEFVRLAGSPNQLPVPLVPGAPFFRRTVEAAGYEAMTFPDRDPAVILRDAETRIQAHLDRQREGRK